jgi:uncharacterized protein with von Willebrand factor type A (vWA) domain
VALGRAFRYARWDGTQEVEPFDPSALFDALADRLLGGLDLDSGLANTVERGFEGLPGLRELLARLEHGRDELIASGRVAPGEVERLARQLREALAQGRGADVDGELVDRVLGPGSAGDLARLQALAQTLAATGLVRVVGERVVLTPEGIRRIGRRALQELFAHLRAGRVGAHRAREAGQAGEGQEDSRRYQWGDALVVDLAATLMNALRRGGDTALRAEDFEVRRVERATRGATVLLLDTSRSMLQRGCVGAAKRVAIALDELIRTAYPTDSLRIVGFAERARELSREELVGFDFNQFVYGTNLQHGLTVARELLARERAPTRQVVLITDGEPTAHFERGQIRFAYPPTFQTFRETLREVGRCTREGITINTFMLERSRYLSEFVEQMTRLNRGRAFYADPARLGDYVLVDYLANRRRRLT